MAEAAMTRKLVAILAADVAGYSRLMGADETGTLRALIEHRQNLWLPAIERHGGRLVGTSGDGLLAEFHSAVAACECALAVQQGMAERNRELPEDRQMLLRIGVNVGEVIVDGDDIYGDGVNVAARLETLADPGGICISRSVQEQVRRGLEVNFRDDGEHRVKNIAEPVHVWRWPAGGGGVVAAPAPTAPGRSSIAVLPFNNMSDNPTYEYIADGLTEDVITWLARLPGFLVIARNSSFAYKGQSPDIRQVGRELGVRYVVEGSLRPVGTKVRVTVQLIDAETGQHLWADRFERGADEFDALQDEVTAGIVAQLEPELTRAEINLAKRRPPADMDAWAYYQQAHGLLGQKGWRRDTFAEAEELLRKATDLDPEFALAHAYRSLLLALGHMFGLSPEGDRASVLAVEVADRAMSLDSQSSSVLGYAGCALSDVGQTERGIEILRRAVDQDPSNAQAWVALGSAMIRQGKARKGVEHLRHGMRISPKDARLAYWGSNLAYTLYRLGQTDEALREIELACRRGERLHMAWIVRALISAASGRNSDAATAMAEALRIEPNLGIENVRPLIGRRGAQILSDAGLLE